MYKTIVVAIGSTIMTDDAVGHFVLRELQKRDIPADFSDLDTDIFRLRLDYNNHQHIIIVDALVGYEDPGTVKVFSFDEFHERLEGKIWSPHLLGVIEALDIMRTVDEDMAKATVHLVGIVVEKLDVGMELTENVASSIISAADSVEKIVREYAKTS